MKGINIAETCHVVNLIPPADNSAGVTSSVVDMKNYAHATVIVQIGSANADMGDIILEQCDDLTPTTHPDFAFNYYAELDATGDVLDTGPTLVTAAAGIAHTVFNANNTMAVIEIDASELTSGYRGFRVNITAAGGATFTSAVAILSGARYAKYGSPTVLA